MAGYPRVIGYVAGGYYPGLGVYGADPGAPPMGHPGVPMLAHPHGGLPVHGVQHPAIHSPPWRPMVAPGSPPLGEGHVPLPLNPETFATGAGSIGQWGGVGGAPAGTVITFSARPQKPFKAARLLVKKTNVGPTALGSVIGQSFVGTDLQQGELGFADIESMGAATAFDTWVSFKQAEPGVWIRIQATLTAFPTGADTTLVTVTAMGHYLH